MKERPILFSGPMICAIRAGRKTQTRRVVQNLVEVRPGVWMTTKGLPWVANEAAIREDGLKVLGCPYVVPGDRLWVKESRYTSRVASSLTLSLFDRWIERLQDISDADASAEGIPRTADEAIRFGWVKPDRTLGRGWETRTRVDNYARLWDSLNGKRRELEAEGQTWLEEQVSGGRR